MSEYFRSASAEFGLAVQLCTDLEHMPIENTNKEWPEAERPYWPVARLVLPLQDAISHLALEDVLAFCPAHSQAGHRPLGGINRARLRAYAEISALRRRADDRVA